MRHDDDDEATSVRETKRVHSIAPCESEKGSGEVFVAVATPFSKVLDLITSVSCYPFDFY